MFMFNRFGLRGIVVILAAGALCGVAPASGVFPSDTMTATQTFTDALGGTTMMLDWDGTGYWSCSGASASGVRLARYSAAFATQGTYSPGLDFRSVFSDASGNVYARQYSNRTIYKQTSPGVFATYATLATDTAGGQASQVGVVLMGTGLGYVAQDSGTLYQWNLSGGLIQTVALSGYGSLNSESSYPQNARVAAWGSYYLTYSNGALSAWNASGNRVGQMTLTGAGTTFDSNFSLSYANGYVWVVDAAGGLWRGYQIGTPAVVTPTVPVASPLALGILGMMLVAFAAWTLRARATARG
jgi:hypothetical protein